MEDKNFTKEQNHLYFLVVDGKKSEPLTFNQLKEKSIGEDDLVWRKGLEVWVKARDLKELSEIIVFNPPPIPRDDETTSIDSKNNNFNISKNKWILVVFLLIACIFTFLIFQIFNESNDFQKQLATNSQTSDTRQNDSLIEEISPSNKTEFKEDLPVVNKSENKSSVSLPKNYFLSQNEKVIYYFDDINNYWWSKVLNDDPRSSYPILTSAEMNYVYNTKWKIQINDWNIETFDFGVNMLNKKFKKQGKPYKYKLE